MHYKYTIAEMCDECRMLMLKDDSIASAHMIHNMNQGGANDCNICGRIRVMTKSVLTNYRVVPEDDMPVSEIAEVLRARAPRSIDEGFALLWAEDEIERNKVVQCLEEMHAEEEGDK